MVVGAEYSSRDRGSQARLGGTRIRTAQPTGDEPRAELQVVTGPKALDLLASEGHEERSLSPVVD